MHYHNHSSAYSTPVECSQPIVVVSHKVGLCRVDQKGKPSSTLFTRLSYNGKSSLLQCETQAYFYNYDVLLLGEPKTGRMHQIRIHLQWLGKKVVEKDFCQLYSL